jgi:hypothetical protein
MIDYHHIIEVAPLNNTHMHWEITNTNVLIAKGTAIYILPLIRLDDDDDQWFKFGYCVVQQVLEDYGKYTLVLFEGIQHNGEALFSVF